MPTPRWRGNHGPSTCSTLVSTVKQYHMPYKQHRCILGAVWGDSDGGIEISSWDPSAGKTCGNSTCDVLMIITRTNACQTTSISRLRRPYSGATGGQKMASGGKFSPMASRLLMLTIGGHECRKPLRRGLRTTNGLGGHVLLACRKAVIGHFDAPRGRGRRRPRTPGPGGGTRGQGGRRGRTGGRPWPPGSPQGGARRAPEIARNFQFWLSRATTGLQIRQRD